MASRKVTPRAVALMPEVPQALLSRYMGRHYATSCSCWQCPYPPTYSCWHWFANSASETGLGIFFAALCDRHAWLTLDSGDVRFPPDLLIPWPLVPTLMDDEPRRITKRASRRGRKAA